MTSPETFFQTSNGVREKITSTEKRRESSAENLAKAVEEIKQYIHAEIEALKAEIKSLL